VANEKKYGLRGQLSLAIALIVLLTVGLAALLANNLIGRQFERYVTNQQDQRIQDIVGGLDAQYNPLAGWNESLVHAAGMYALYNGYIVKVYDQKGRTVWDAENHDMALCGSIMGEISERMSHWRSAANGRRMSRKLDLTYNGKNVGTVVVSYYGPFFFTENDFEFLNTLNIALAATAGIALLVALGVGMLLASRIARPVVRTAAIAGRIAAGDYQVRYEGRTGSRELTELVQSVNQLAAALESQEALRRRLTGDVAHELRTPLASVGAHLEAMIDGVWSATPERLTGLQEEVQRLTGLVKDLEALADAESGDLKLETGPVELNGLAREVGRKFELELSKKRLAFEVEGEALALGDRARLHQVLTNLIGNAVKYTPEGGHIRVSAYPEGGQAVVEVRDDGIGIPQDALKLIFERFYRVDPSRNRRTGGAGIGLAIVQSIVRAHGGTVEAESWEGQGSRFVVKLPAALEER
jgi:signal transduction histidine kinase